MKTTLENQKENKNNIKELKGETKLRISIVMKNRVNDEKI